MSTELFDDAVVKLEGRVLHRPEVRVRVVDAVGHSVPVLCFDIVTPGQTQGVAHIEQPFPAGHHDQAEMAARRLKAGTHVCVDHPVRGPRLVLPNATHVHVLHEERTA